MSVTRSLSYERVHNAIVAAILAGDFYSISWDKDTRLATISETVGNKQSPSSIRVGQVSAQFGLPIAHRRSAAYERLDWIWEAEVLFATRVSTEAFESSITHTVLRIAADPDNDLPQLTIKLTQAVYHEKTHESERGTGATFTFAVQQTPI